MRIRALRPSDSSTVERLQKASGYAFKFPDTSAPLIEAAFIVEDDAGEALAVCVAKRAPEVVMALSKSPHPRVKMRALTLIHESMRRELKAKGYTEANCFLPPELERGYGRHLRKIFGWIPAWKAYTLRDE